MIGDKANEPERIYYYYRCRGKYEDDDSGGKRRICKGYIFSLKSRMAECPVCGEPLTMLQSDKELTEAVTCELKNCFSCPSRQRSMAVNDYHCLGGDCFRDGRIQKVIGTRLCEGCLCAACCHEIINDANSVKKYGFDAVINARLKLREIARAVVQSGTVSNETDSMIAEAKSQNPVLYDINEDTFVRWVETDYSTAERGLKTVNASNVI
jgi:hypothetical protein